jgi:eukaryotic-like serine/threonine-protein kinase
LPGPAAALTEALSGRYTIERELGRGGMATVYLAQDTRHHRPVAIKVLHTELSHALGPERFVQEIDLVARLQHPHILPLHDSGEARGYLYYVMPYVAGGTLRNQLTRERQFPLEDALRVVAQVASALAYAHQQGVIHRDIKPENILMTGDQAVLADFGIAAAIEFAGGERLTETGLALGTPAYMSPEQAAGDRLLDARTDIYSLGCVAYEMLAGQPPFTGPTARSIIARHTIDPVPSLRTVRSTVSVALEAAITRALAKVPADRFGSAAEFARALTTTTTSYPLTSPIRGKHRALLFGAAASGALLVALVLLHRPGPAHALNPRLVAVLPFRVAGADPELAWLREGIVDLLAIKLTGEGGLRAAEPRVVLSALHQLAGSSGEVTPEIEVQIAERLGAGRVIDGGVVGTPHHLTLTASILMVPRSRAAAQAMVEGPADSMQLLVDRLAGQLLGAEAAVESHRLSSLTSTSLPAVRAYLAGRAAFRKGRVDEAARRFDEATELDSNFALAAMELMRASGWTGTNAYGERAQRLALAGRNRLSLSDRTILDVSTGQWSTGPEMFRKWSAAASAYPDRPDIWYGLGDSYYHWGGLVGVDEPLRRAEEAFHRGWALDSSFASDSMLPERSPVFAEPLTHMVELAQVRRDTAEVRRLVALGLAADSTGEQSLYLQWHLAFLGGDSARKAFWIRPNLPCDLGGRVGIFVTWNGFPVDDEQRLQAKDSRCQGGDADLAAMVRPWAALNAGRPHEALQSVARPLSVWRIGDALYWGGDTNAAIDIVRRLRRQVEAWHGRGEQTKSLFDNVCMLTQWDLARGKTHGANAAIRMLHEAWVPGLSPAESAEFARYTILCGSLLEALQAFVLGRPDAQPHLQRLDSLARTLIFAVCCGESVSGANLVAARLWENQGDLPRALAAIRRRGSGYGLAPLYLSTFDREEGRLAALAGDAAGAIRAYKHYLALRGDPEPEVTPEVVQVRMELARLMANRPKP